MTRSIQLPELSDKEFVTRIREHGLRLTPQRLAVYRVLVENDQHPTAAMVFEQLRGQLPSLSQATVYNTLQVFVKKGLVHEIGDAGDGSTHYDADIKPHINLICVRCHQIVDYHDERIAEVYSLLAEDSGYAIQGVRMAYYGLCPECQMVEQWE